jgi:hypothetical protein
LLTAAGDCNDDGEVGGMNGFGRGNQRTYKMQNETPALGAVECNIHKLPISILRPKGSYPN